MNTISIQKTGITELSADAIVNAANEGLQAGGGVCGAIFREAGHRELQDFCNAIGHCNTGSAVITPGFRLKARYIIHAVGPMWFGGEYEEPKLLYGAYRTSLNLARESECRSVGFPLISAGIFGYPTDKAWKVAIEACRDFFDEYPDADIQVVFAVLDDAILELGQQTLKKEAAQYMEQPGKDPRFTFFWNDDEENGVFSNWYCSPFVVEGVTYQHVEQYMMAQKAKVFHDGETYEEIMKTDEPGKCKELGRKVTSFDTEKWDAVRYGIVKAGNRAKFEQYPELKEALLKTGSSILAEASPEDRIWGIGLDRDAALDMSPMKWPGQNLMGKILTELREEFQEEKSEQAD